MRELSILVLKSVLAWWVSKGQVKTQTAVVYMSEAPVVML